MHVQPYLFFDGRGEEAVEFYRSVLGPEVTDARALQGQP
jgi:PhnB protein